MRNNTHEVMKMQPNNRGRMETQPDDATEIKLMNSSYVFLLESRNVFFIFAKFLI